MGGEDLVRWVSEGNQKSAVLRVMTHVMPGKVILRRARAINSRITKRDVWGILQAAIEKGVVECLTPQAEYGKVYTLTVLGSTVIYEAFGLLSCLPPMNIDWYQYAYILSGAVRTNVFLEVQPGLSARRRVTDIKRALRGRFGISINHTIRAVDDLLKAGLIHKVGESAKRSCALYDYTDMGQKIVNAMRLFKVNDPFSRGVGEKDGRQNMQTFGRY